MEYYSDDTILQPEKREAILRSFSMQPGSPSGGAYQGGRSQAEDNDTEQLNDLFNSLDLGDGNHDIQAFKRVHAVSRTPPENPFDVDSLNQPLELDSTIGLYSIQTESVTYFAARFTQRLQHSLIHSSVMRVLDMTPMELPEELMPQILITPFGVTRPQRYVRAVLHQTHLGISMQSGYFLIFDDPQPSSGPSIYLGQRFLDQCFGGAMPRLLP